ncbi:uncharacterized protein LOC116258434 isoform X2 [Nymphaea colorata]|uniref:uncharacterized protein LOC116258434 isoform X2 n=1 Tax=Nymphaea colorata TaxID=210225 RepID=UPI00129E7EAC|nr:uncharacterized protein LOC116258434 isoform X2 [Nymphaea colorata]
MRHITAWLGRNGWQPSPNRDSIQDCLIQRSSSRSQRSDSRWGVKDVVARFLGRIFPQTQISKLPPEGGSEEKEKVITWLRSLALTERDLAFEYVNSTERGLSFKEAARRLKENGPNIAFEHTFSSWWQLLWRAFFHPFNVLLLVLSAVSFIAGDTANGSIMLVLVSISVGLRFFQEFNSLKAAIKLSELLKTPVRVQRCAGRVVQTELIVQIEQKDVVPGDIIHFSPGDLFPGDVRLLNSKDLVVSQSSLTGESGTVEKIADIREGLTTPVLELRNICFMGTSVASGSGTGLVISTGPKTYISTIFSTLGKWKTPDAFEKGVRHVSYALVCFMLVIVPIEVFVDYCSSNKLSQSIIFGMSVAVGLTPQMLPLIVNTNLAKGTLAMAKDRCLVKSSVAIQNMGAMDILCMDKTGTLTMDRAILFHHIDAWAVPRERILHFAFLSSYFKTVQQNPIDQAILAYTYTGGYRFEPSKWTKINEIPFDFTRRRASIILEGNTSNILTVDFQGLAVKRLMITKGALDELLSICTFIEHIESSTTVALDPMERQRILNTSEELGNEGLRVLGIAAKALRLEMNNTKEDESDMVFLGFLCFYDPPKDTVKQALWCLAEKGVKAKVLTGDSLPLAIKVCKEVGIRTTNVITGPDLEMLDQDAFDEMVKKVTVLARLTPTQKLRVVQSLKTSGNHIVGFLGDGINDSLALEAADVGISVDSGASVAKDVADIILLEKDLNVLVAGVVRGRITHGNTMKYIKMSVVANIASVISLLVATVCLPFEPLSPTQILTQNLLYNVGQILIPWDKMDDEYVSRPHRWSAKGILLFMIWNGPVSSICDIGTFLFLCWYYKANTYSMMNFFHSAWFLEGLLMQTLIIHLIRTEKIPFVQETASWPVILSTVLASVIGIAIPFTPIGKALMWIRLTFWKRILSQQCNIWSIRNFRHQKVLE